MKVEQVLINLLDASSQRFGGSGNDFSKNSFEATLSMVSDRNMNNSRAPKNAFTENSSVSTREANVRGRETSRNTNQLNGRASREVLRGGENNSAADNISTIEESNAPIDDSANVVAVDANEKTSYTLDIADDEPEALYNAALYVPIIIAVAEVLEVSEADIEVALEELDVAPHELKDKANLNKLLQIVYDVENPVELLDVPNIMQVLSTLDTSIEEVFTSVSTAQNDVVSLEETLSSATNASNNVDLNQNTSDFQQNESHKGNAFVSDENVSIDMPIENQDVLDLQVSINLAQAQAHSPNILSDISTEGKAHFNIDKANASIKGMPLKSQPVQSPIARDVVNQITERIKFDVKGAVSEIRMLLKPENLGEISLKVLTENGIVTAQLLADNQKIKEIIEANLNELKEALSEQGINVSELSVSVGQDDTTDQMQNFLKQQEKSQLRISKMIKDIMYDSEDEKQQEPIDMANVYNNSVNYTA